MTRALFAAVLLLAPSLDQMRGFGQDGYATPAYQLEVLVDGAARPVYSQWGANFVEGRIGERYVIRVHNRTWRRVEAVVSVDGRDAIDGQPSSLDKRGYVILPDAYVDIDGFRLSMQEVAAFRFTTVPDSYGSRMGTPWQVGVIGVALFPELILRPPPTIVGRDKSFGGVTSRADDQSAPEAQAKARQGRNLGTEFGERRGSSASETRFTRQSWTAPAARLALRYDDRQGLCAVGIGAFCAPPDPPPYPPPYPPPPEPRFSEPPPGWEHYSPWY